MAPSELWVNVFRSIVGVTSLFVNAQARRQRRGGQYLGVFGLGAGHSDAVGPGLLIAL
jgi:hypothetical protein